MSLTTVLRGKQSCASPCQDYWGICEHISMYYCSPSHIFMGHAPPVMRVKLEATRDVFCRNPYNIITVKFSLSIYSKIYVCWDCAPDPTV